MLKYVLMLQKDDHDYILQTKAEFMQKTASELVSLYNRQVEIGIVGVHRQAVMLFTLRLTMLEIFGQSPILLHDNIILELSGKAWLSEGKLMFDPAED